MRQQRQTTLPFVLMHAQEQAAGQQTENKKHLEKIKQLEVGGA